MDDKRFSDIARGIKHGAIKESIDKLLKFTRPMSDVLKPQIQKLHPKLNMVDPAVDSAIEWATLFAMSEVIKAAGVLSANIPGVKLSSDEVNKRLKAYADYMLRYSGERVGADISKNIKLLFPLVKNLISGVDKLDFKTIGLIPDKLEDK